MKTKLSDYPLSYRGIGLFKYRHRVRSRLIPKGAPLFSINWWNHNRATVAVQKELSGKRKRP